MLESLLAHLPGRLRRALDALGVTPRPPGPGTWGDGHIEEVAEFGTNPGALAMKLYVPATPPRRGAPLLVLLHGCGQDAVRFARAAGWTQLADRLGTPLLLPEQVGANNAGRCFNWFEPGDVARTGGEVESIRQMTEATLGRFRGDPRRVFVAGLSAGGAMAAALLAACPDVYAAGAVVAGMPVGSAGDVPTALKRMARAGADLNETAWADRARANAPPGYAGAWPRISVWQGTADRVVDPANAANLEAQWRALHRLDATPSLDLAPRPGVRRRVWRNSVELWTIEGMAHGFPVASPTAEPFVLDAGIDCATETARFWGLLGSG